MIIYNQDANETKQRLPHNELCLTIYQETIKIILTMFRTTHQLKIKIKMLSVYLMKAAMGLKLTRARELFHTQATFFRMHCLVWIVFSFLRINCIFGDFFFFLFFMWSKFDLFQSGPSILRARAAPAPFNLESSNRPALSAGTLEASADDMSRTPKRPKHPSTQSDVSTGPTPRLICGPRHRYGLLALNAATERHVMVNPSATRVWRLGVAKFADQNGHGRLFPH